MIGPTAYYLHRGRGSSAAGRQGDEFKRLVREERALSRGDFAKSAAFYAAFPKDSQLFLVAVRIGFLAAVATGDVLLFDEIQKDIAAYPERYDSPFAAVGGRIMRNWIQNFLGGNMGELDYMRDFPLSDFPEDWRYATALLVMKCLHLSGEYLASWGVSELLLNMGTGAPDPAADLHIKVTRTLICQELGRMDDADCWARQAVESARAKGVVLPFLGQLLGPRAPLEKNLRELAPDLYLRARSLSANYFRGILKLHNRLTGEQRTENMTPREFFVARSLVRGLSYKEVALRLGIAYSRVNELVTELHEKFGVRTTAEMKPLVW